jgi:septal ring factor EnvC (AmiA/AmiB activator)
MATPPRPPPPVPEEVRLHEPATVEDVRSLRRWIWVAGIWALAASIIALIALLDSGGSSDSAATAQSDVARVEEKLTGRLDNIEQALDEKASTEDVQKLQDRLDKLEQDVSDAADAATQASDDVKQVGRRVDDLATRVEELEAGPPPEGGSP